jgi:hypothetical protein
VQDAGFLGCLARIDQATITTVSLGGFGIDVDSMTNFLAADILLSNLFVDLRVDLVIAGIGTTCDHFTINAAATNIFGDYGLDPDPGTPTTIDVNQLNSIDIAFGGFSDNVDCGGIGFLTFLINLVGADIQTLMGDGLRDFLDDPDGGGPQDAAIAQAVEDALSGIELTGPIGDGFGVTLTTPMFDIPEDNAGITLASGAIMATKVPDPTAPMFSETLHIPASYPFAQLASQTTPGGIIYDMGLAIAESGFNQILAAMVESGSLATDLSEIDLAGTGTPIALTAGLMGLIIPEFAQLPPALPLTFRIRPTLAPVLTGDVGPSGEIADLLIGHLLVDVISGPPGMESLHGRMAIDAAAAFDLTIEAGTGNLVPAIASPDPADILITLLDNPLCMDEGTLQTVIPQLMAPLFPSLAGAFGSFPLPSFLGVQPSAVEVSRVGDFLGVFLTVVPTP